MPLQFSGPNSRINPTFNGKYPFHNQIMSNKSYSSKSFDGKTMHMSVLNSAFETWIMLIWPLLYIVLNGKFPLNSCVNLPSGNLKYLFETWGGRTEHTYINHTSGWWFQPLWKIGMIIPPICLKKYVPNHQPDILKLVEISIALP